jgi:hypothetical protein
MVLRYVFTEVEYVKIESVVQGAFNFRHSKNFSYRQHIHSYYQMSAENYSRRRIN